MFVPADVWFCCLGAGDKAAVIGAAALYTAELMQPIPTGVFDLVWAASPLFMFAGHEAVLTVYGLEDTFIFIPDEPPIPAVGILNEPLWLDIEAFLLTGGAGCPDDCDAPSYLI